VLGVPNCGFAGEAPEFWVRRRSAAGLRVHPPIQEMGGHHLCAVRRWTRSSHRVSRWRSRSVIWCPPISRKNTDSHGQTRTNTDGQTDDGRRRRPWNDPGSAAGAHHAGHA